MAFALVVLIAVPVIVLGGGKVIYVDEDASGTEDGSSDHPYKTISRALKHAKDGTEVRVRSGEYKENITIPKEVKVVGNSKDNGKVVIKADHRDEAVVTMKDDAELFHVTVKNGKHGIRVESDAEVHIYDVHIKDNKKDGISLRSAPRNKKHQALIDDVKITGNGRSGIYSEKRKVILINSEISRNGSDGIDFDPGTEAWVEKNKINDNRGSGAVFTLDGSAIWTKSNSIRNNKREGIEINGYGTRGDVGIKKATIIGNGNYGVAKVARTTAGLQNMANIIFGTEVNANRIEGNRAGNISGVLRGF
ncbi:MAG: hypothetical protein A2808_00820 [Candidatus Moranbacteria bacterium RIFCSPHIGHO2_01_FULL_55_24]|nr:MAG: hypothetical protein A2808_00820 [Candidatus Moranbacteria bacterium RIFCSPHIGHO2_01_FULL_55_24]